jgi:hypothetical protein
MLAELLMDIGDEETEPGGEASRFWQTLRNSISFIVFAREITTGEKRRDPWTSQSALASRWLAPLGIPVSCSPILRYVTSLLIGSRYQIIGRKPVVKASREQVIVR